MTFSEIPKANCELDNAKYAGPKKLNLCRLKISNY